MTRVAGIDVADGRVRVAVLRAVYRKVQLERLVEEDIAAYESEADALKACLVKAGVVDVVSASIAGSETFVHRLRLPASAARRISEVLPFELEGELPIELGDLVYDYEVLPRSSPADSLLSVVTLAARRASVQQVIERVEQASGLQPETIGASHLELAQLGRLSAALSSAEPTAIIYLGYDGTDVCLTASGLAQAARSLSVGIGEFPEGAERLVAELRQTLSGLASQAGVAATRVVLTGDGAELDGMTEFLAARLRLVVELLPVLLLEGVDELDRARLPRFARSLACAAHGLRRQGFDLRQGDLAFARGYGFLKERAPLLTGLVFAIVLSFLFATWAQGRALKAENLALVASLEMLTQQAFGELTSDPDEAEATLQRIRSARPEDPMPYLDGFGVAVALAETMPAGIKHDVEQFEYAKGKVTIRGVVSSTDEAQRVAKAFEEHRCIETANISKISQVVNSDRERYVMDAKVECPEDVVEGDKKAKKPAEAP